MPPTPNGPDVSSLLAAVGRTPPPEAPTELMLPADDLAAVLAHAGHRMVLRDWAVDDHVGVALADTDTPDQPQVVLVPDSTDDTRDTHVSRLVAEFSTDLVNATIPQQVMVQDTDGAALLVSETGTAVHLRLLACTHCGRALGSDDFDAASQHPWCNTCCDDPSLWACEGCSRGFREYDTGADPNAITGHVNNAGTWCDDCHTTEVDTLDQAEDAGLRCRTHDNQCFVHGWDG